MQVLLSSLRMQKIVTMPPPLSPRDEAFAPKLGLDAAVARESENGARWRLQGFVPVAGVSRQRRSFFPQESFGQSLQTERQARSLRRQCVAIPL